MKVLFPKVDTLVLVDTLCFWPSAKNKNAYPRVLLPRPLVKRNTK